jgi:hypothetical protein
VAAVRPASPGADVAAVRPASPGADVAAVRPASPGADVAPGACGVGAAAAECRRRERVVGARALAVRRRPRRQAECGYSSMGYSRGTEGCYGTLPYPTVPYSTRRLHAWTHVTPCRRLHVARCALHVACCTLHVARCMLRCMLRGVLAADWSCGCCALRASCCTLHVARCAFIMLHGNAAGKSTLHAYNVACL